MNKRYSKANLEKLIRVNTKLLENRMPTGIEAEIRHNLKVGKCLLKTTKWEK